MTEASFLTSLISGGLAGTAADVFLFPLDTIKTRLQSPQGFMTAGGFSRIYAGLGPAAVGSAPNAALFFCTYETIKKQAVTKYGGADSAGLHMFAASGAGEVVACLVRVPTEIVKQRRQAGAASHGLAIVRSTISSEGVLGLYRAYFTTLSREIPFSLIQFPLYEFLKKQLATSQEAPNPWQASSCGAVAGGFSAAVTTPLDVAKTRIMLAKAGTFEASLGTLGMIKFVMAEKGVSGLFAGLAPRVTWISIGGALFFGVYEKAKSVL